MPAGAHPRMVNVNGNVGQRVTINYTIWARGATIAEDESVNPLTGIVVFFPDDNFVQGYQYLNAEPVIFGDPTSHGRGRGRILGGPANSSGGGSKAADVMCQIISATAAATKVQVVEIE